MKVLCNVVLGLRGSMKTGSLEQETLVLPAFCSTMVTYISMEYNMAQTSFVFKGKVKISTFIYLILSIFLRRMYLPT